MTDSLPPNQRPPRLRDDEPIALLVAFLAFAAIFGWALNQGQDRLPWTGLLSGLTSSPTPTVAPTVRSPLVPVPTPNPFLFPGGAISPGGITRDRPDESTRVVPSPQPTTGTATPDTTVVPSPQPTIGATTPDGTIVPVPQPTGAPNRTIVVVPISPSPTATVPASPSPTATVPITPPVPAPTATGSAKTFPDVPPSYWAAPFIAALSARGIIGGFPDGTFKPEQPVTRAQYAVQLQKAFPKPDRLPPKGFSDVPANSQWATAVDKAVKGNFMSGYPEGDFRPDQQVSRAEAIASMVQGLELKQPADPEAILQPYTDRTQVPSWARGRVAAAIQAGIFPTNPNSPQSLNPTQPATRGDIAALVYKGLEASGTPLK